MPGLPTIGWVVDEDGQNWKRLGRPMSVVLYPDVPAGIWRHAIYYAGGVMGGRLSISVDTPLDGARAAMERNVSRLGADFYDSQFSVVWGSPDDRGWLTGEIVSDAR